MSFADFWEDEILDHLFGKGSYSPPTIYVGLSTADPLDDASGLAEVSGNNYARVQTAGGDWDVSSGGATANANAVTFPTASGSWGTVSHICLFDASSAGNLLASVALDSSQAVTTDQIPRFSAGEIDVTLG
ncbi:hypothetical protein LCGC14_0960230 [marine sediment metagenome]|uniref:Uncharacterized protein n=1 Tax=marine sediment metagenome TaxID=412755 RepID=A0A0F9P0U7_9ZZZZ